MSARHANKSDNSSSNQDLITLVVKTMNGNRYEIRASPTQQILLLQAQIEQKTGVPIAAQRLLFKAVMLEPLKKLQDYRIIEPGMVIKLVANRISSEPSIHSSPHASERARVNLVTQQNQLYKKHRYIQQRINGFNIEKVSDAVETIRQNKNTLNQLLECLSKDRIHDEAPFQFKNRRLDVGDWVDIREASGSWVQGQVVKKKANYVQVHYNGLPEHNWNQWIEQSSDRMMPFKSQTVISEKCASLSPVPMNTPLIKNLKGTSRTSAKKIISQVIEFLPDALTQISGLFSSLRSEVSRPEDEDYGEQEQNISFKNNRSQHSPPQSIQQEEYEYDIDMQGQDNVVMLESNKVDLTRNKDSSSIRSGSRSRIPDKYNRVNYNRVVSNRKWNVGLKKTKLSNGGMRTTSIIRHMNHNTLSSSASFKDEQQLHVNKKAESQAGQQLGRLNPSSPWSYSKTKSQYEHQQFRQNQQFRQQQNYNQHLTIEDEGSNLIRMRTHEQVDIMESSSNTQRQKRHHQVSMKRQIIFDNTKQEEEDDQSYQKPTNTKEEESYGNAVEFHKKYSDLPQKSSPLKFNVIHTYSEHTPHPSSEIDDGQVGLLKEEIEASESQQEISRHQEDHKFLLAYSSSHIAVSPIPGPSSIQADNLSNQCEQNLSNKGQGEQEDDMSAKSFGSKRSERLLDASSMKSLIIDATRHNEDDNKSQEKKQHHRRNILVIDQAQVQSVSAKAPQSGKSKTHRFNSYYFNNQQGILQEEDSLADEPAGDRSGNINTQQNEPHFNLEGVDFARNKANREFNVDSQARQEQAKLVFTQLAPLCDRLGRLLVDLAPHLAGMGYTEFSENPQYNENLSTFTNEGSLHSRMQNLSRRNYNPSAMEDEQSQNSRSVRQGWRQNSKKSLKSKDKRYWNFQVPVMLTPWQIMRINRLLQQQNGNLPLGEQAAEQQQEEEEEGMLQ